MQRYERLLKKVRFNQRAILDYYLIWQLVVLETITSAQVQDNRKIEGNVLPGFQSIKVCHVSK